MLVRQAKFDLVVAERDVEKALGQSARARVLGLEAELQIANAASTTFARRCDELTERLRAAEAERDKLREDLSETTQQLIEALQGDRGAARAVEAAGPVVPVQLTGPEVVERAMRHRNQSARRRA